MDHTINLAKSTLHKSSPKSNVRSSPFLFTSIDFTSHYSNFLKVKHISLVQTDSTPERFTVYTF